MLRGRRALKGKQTNSFPAAVGRLAIVLVTARSSAAGHSVDNLGSICYVDHSPVDSPGVVVCCIVDLALTLGP